MSDTVPSSQVWSDQNGAPAAPDRTPRPIDGASPYHFVRWFLGLLLLPFTLLAGWVVVWPREAKIVLLFGQLWKVIDTPGLNFIVPWGCSFESVFLNHVTKELSTQVIADLNANPVVVGAIVNYHIVDPVKAHFNVENVSEYIEMVAAGVMKRVLARYPYESKDPNVPSLRSSIRTLRVDLRNALNERVHNAGISVSAFDLTELFYAPEIAAQMLIRQQAQAKVDARSLIVKGAVDIVACALDGLQTKGVDMNEDDAASLASNLLCILTGEGRVMNTLPLKGDK
eukprot:Rhum_TRINITY_DN11620_c0_g1::Rhum_TRINITY_DN11620_c0_g1_i1::g.45876::m.45876